MKKTFFGLVILLSQAVIFNSKAQAQKINDDVLFNTVVNNHDQLFELSCIPSAVEMILKYYKAVDLDFYDLQKEWKNKTDGSFRNFDNKKLYGITFHQKFVLSRDATFPMDSLFRTVTQELRSGRKVIISIPSDPGWHMFIICDQTPDGEFVAYSKLGTHTLILKNIKEIVKKSNGTEIMTYSISSRL